MCCVVDLPCFEVAAAVIALLAFLVVAVIVAVVVVLFLLLFVCKFRQQAFPSTSENDEASVSHVSPFLAVFT